MVTHHLLLNCVNFVLHLGPRFLACSSKAGLWQTCVESDPKIESFPQIIRMRNLQIRFLFLSFSSNWSSGLPYADDRSVRVMMRKLNRRSWNFRQITAYGFVVRILYTLGRPNYRRIVKFNSSYWKIVREGKRAKFCRRQLVDAGTNLVLPKPNRLLMRSY